METRLAREQQEVMPRMARNQDMKLRMTKATRNGINISKKSTETQSKKNAKQKDTIPCAACQRFYDDDDFVDFQWGQCTQMQTVVS
jgi:hypothetical protein